MAPNHYLTFLQIGKETTAYYSFYAPDDLIIFVHGFAGHATKTWNDFPIEIRKDQSFRYADIIYYGYKSLTQQLNASANDFYHNLNKLVTPHERLSNPKNRNSPTIPVHYKRIILVGHSLGAVLIRKALLIANFNNKEWVKSTKMLLFAPAHRGAYPKYLILASIPFPFSLLGYIAHFKFPVLHDVDPDSKAIVELNEETRTLLISEKGEFTKAYGVFYAPGDPVVQAGKFGEDATELPIHSKNHTSICKMIRNFYKKPMIALLNVINNEEICE